MMELDSQNITPPSSPILGYSGCRDEQSILESGVVFCLNCKGSDRVNDFSFSPESFILRREVISALENLNPCNSSAATAGHSTRDCKPRLIKCFNHHFDPTDKNHLKTLIEISRKSISTLEILSEAAHSFLPVSAPGIQGLVTYEPIVNLAAVDGPDEALHQNPWTLRSNICQFLNLVVRQLRLYRTSWSAEDLAELFIGLKKSLGSVKDWSPVLRSHCGFRSGNECSSSSYHFFHLQLELRWSLLLIFGVTPQVIDWVLDDLISLCWSKYTIDDGSSLDERRPFNCTCTKEIWTMIRLVVDDLQPLRKNFWDFYAEAMGRFSNNSDVYFSIWLTANLAEISEFTVSGVFIAGRGREESINGKNGYKYLHDTLKEWTSRGGKSAEILKLMLKCFQHWGADCDILLTLWNQWVPRLDKGNDVTDFEPYSSVEHWFQFISEIGNTSLNLKAGDIQGREAGERTNLGWNCATSSDMFMNFVYLVSCHAKSCSEKEMRRLKTNICMKLTRCNASEFGELGLIRVSTLFMVLSFLSESSREAMSINERFVDIVSYDKARASSRRKTLFRAYSVMIAICAQKSADFQNAGLIKNYMKIVDEMLCYGGSDPTMKDVIMIYVELLKFLPKICPSFGITSLKRSLLLSSNLSMWLGKCDANYLLRTIRALSQLSAWIVSVDSSSCEPKEIFAKLSDKCLPLIKSMVVLNANRIPSTDMEPLANLAADINILSRKYSKSGRASEECMSQFDLFAMNERTCPNFSQHYVERLFKCEDINLSCFGKMKWMQVWVRLLALDCTVSEELTELVLGTDFCSTSNLALIEAFCQRSDMWGADEIQSILVPLTVLLKGVVTATMFKDVPSPRSSTSNSANRENITSSVIRSSVIMLKKIPFDKIYLKGVTSSCGHKFMEHMIPQSWPGIPPWEKLTDGVMKALESNLFDIFYTLIANLGSGQDTYLCRKLQDIVVFSVFGFIRNLNNIDKNEHPALKILNYCEDKNITQVQNQILPKVIAGDHVLKDIKLSARFLQIVSIMQFKRFPSLVVRVLAGVLKIYIVHPTEKLNMDSCVSAIIYCCQFGLQPFYQESLLNAFDSVLEKEFAFRSRRVFQLCTAIVKANKIEVKKFMKCHLCPLIQKYVELCEQRRGIGYDKSLRAPLDSLKCEIGNVEP